MRLIIDPKIFDQNPDLKIGVIVVKGMNNTKRVSSIESLLRGICAQRGKEFADKDIYEDPMIKPWAQAYGKFGVNPKKFPPSIAALLKRVQGGKEIPHINLLVDLYNYFSLKHLLPIGGEDLDWLCGDLHLNFTKGGEPFRAMGSIDVAAAAEGEAAYMDDGGITCRYWNYRECERTKFTEKTVNAVLFIEDLSRIHLDEFGAILKEIQNCILKYIGGKIESYVLTEERNFIDLGVEGRKNVDDSKVPQQEKAHFLSQEIKKKGVSVKALAHGKRLKLDGDDLHKSQVAKLLNEALKIAFPKVQAEAFVEYPAMPEHGDYATSVALQITKDLKISPRDIAGQILSSLPENQLIEKVEIAGPGFMNFFLSKSALESEVKKILKEKKNYGKSKVGGNKNLIVEYSQPNIAKPLGVHHLLSTIIGQSLYNIFKFIGFNAISINHIGDWGTQFGKLIYAYKKWGDKKTVEQNPIPELLKLYVHFHEEVEKDPTLEDEGRREFKEFENGNKENRELWKWFVEESMKDVQKTYDRLGGIHFDYTQGESFYEDKMDEILKLGEKKKVIVKGEEGAMVVHFPEASLPTVPIKKKDGATLYITRDFAAINYRIKNWKPVKILYVVDVAQSLHFQQLFAAAKMMDLCQDEPAHVLFGRMRMKDSAMSTRKGTVILLNDVLEEVEKRAQKIIEEKNPDLKDKEKAGRLVGVAAIKYSILSQNRSTDITFDWDKMLSFDGNSGPYLQYTFARAKSILRKAQEAKPTIDVPTEEGAGVEKLIHNLLRTLPKFGEYIALSAAEYKPNVLANYLYDLAQKFNAFYNSVPVIRAAKESDRKERLQLVEAASQILENGLGLLGIEIVEQM